MACLHFDFAQAQDYLGDAQVSDLATHQNATEHSIVQAYAEEQTNLNIFENILISLREI